ncbi:discoidin domain-containing protein [Notoacmeibacter marinus]|uniref:discoidin domain-containing protein n=1 Tax=Notoacmeibacter marinus TaxID=1876515 RepID=UPI000DF3683B|nr:discoidin domain-containing protein [Notoacmeibacter marinus]
MRKTVMTAMTALFCCSASSGVSAETLLSAGKSVASDINGATGNLASITDGDLSDDAPYYFSNQSNADRSLTIDLGRSAYVTRLGIHTGTTLGGEAIRKFRLWASTDGENFRPILGATRKRLDYAEIRQDIELAQPVQAHYVKFESLEQLGSSKLREIEVFGSEQRPEQDIWHFFPLDKEEFKEGEEDPAFKARISELNARVSKRFEENLPRSHPRLHGDEAQYWDYFQTFESQNAKAFKGDNYSYATVKNIFSVYNNRTYGMKTTEVNYPKTLRNIPTARFYLDVDLQASDKDLPRGNAKRAMQVLHLIRMIDGCLEFDPDCRFSQANNIETIDVESELGALKQKFIRFEFRDFQRQLSGDNAKHNCAAVDGVNFPRPRKWHHGHIGCRFDLGAIRMFRPWTAIMDYYWDGNRYWERPEDQQRVMDIMTNYAKMYLEQSDPQHKLHWTVSIQNNWNSITGEAALRFATLVYDEPGYESMARELIGNVLKFSWNHRRIYMDEGMYREGTGYMATDYASTGPINNFYMRTIGEPMHAMKWGIGFDNARWLVNAMAPDGHSVNFGDAWKVQGIRNAIPLDMLLWQEMVGIKEPGTTELTKAEQCVAARFFANHFYDDGMSVPMLMGAHLARDWHAEVEACGDGILADSYAANFPFNESVFRIDTGRNTRVAPDTRVTLDKDVSSHAKQSNQTMMAMSCVPNDFPHREIDCFDIKWSVHGSRLIDDTGYGNFNKGYNYYEFKGAKGHVPKTSNADKLEFYVKPVKNVNMDKARVLINVGGKAQGLSIGEWMRMTQPGADGWTHLEIPLTAFDKIEDKHWNAVVNGGKGVSSITFLQGSGLHLSKQASFGVDEVRFTQGNGGSRLWYGDARTASVKGDALQYSKHRLFVKERNGGGAGGTDGWLEIGTDIKATGPVVSFYHDVPEDHVVQNFYDGLPVGANSLIVPDAKFLDLWLARPDQTHRGQLSGKRATGKTFEINTLEGVKNLQGVYFDASEVYGSKEETGGWMEKAVRYKVALPKGNFLIVDDFQTRYASGSSGPRRKSQIQEFWYSPYDDVQTCALPRNGGMSHHVDVRFSGNNTVDFTPRCMILFRGGDARAEAKGRMTASSLAGNVELKFGPPSFMADDPYFRRFVKDDTITQVNRKGGTDVRRLLRFEPPEDVSADVRAFLFQGALAQSDPSKALKQQELQVSETLPGCETQSFCVRATIGGETYTLNFDSIPSEME